MAYTNEMRIQNGLVLDFTLDAADGDNDDLLFVNSVGEVTSSAGLKASRITDGGNLTEATSSVLTITGGTGNVLDDITIEVDQADASNAGYLSSTDWNTFNNKLGTSLTDSYVFVGSSGNVATGVPITGDITIDDTGLVAIASNVIVNADINSAAAIAFTKMAAMTASRAVVSDGSGFLVVESSGVTATQVGYLVNLSADLQGSLNTLAVQIAGQATNAIVQSPTATEDTYAIIWDNGNLEWTLGPVGAGGSVTSAGASTDNAITRWNGTGGTSIQNSGVIIDDSDNITGVATITIGTGGLHLLDSNASHDLIFALDDLTADRTLTINTADADRSITFSGNPTLSDWFDQSVKVAANPTFASVTLSNAGGLHLLDFDESHDLILRTTSDLTADRELVFVTGDAARTLTINASGTLYVTGGTDVALADGGTGASLADPGADRIMFWDDSAGVVTWLEVGSGLSITTTTLSATGGGIGGSTGSTDNAILRADGTGGATVQSSSITISDDSGGVTFRKTSTSGLTIIAAQGTNQSLGDLVLYASTMSSTGTAGDTFVAGGTNSGGTVVGNVGLNHISPITNQWAGGQGVVQVANAVTPASSGGGLPANNFLFWSEDITAGNAAPHFLTEAGHEIQLYTTNFGSAYSITNGATDRAYDANATTTEELADVLYTLIEDLKLTGLIV